MAICGRQRHLVRLSVGWRLVSRLAAALRGLAHRRGSTLLILAVALVAAAAAATGPIYYAAAKTSILRDSLRRGSVVGRGFEAATSGALAGLMGTLTTQVRGQLDTAVGPALARRVFAPPIEDLEASGVYKKLQHPVAVDWRSGVCAHLQIRGSCPKAAGQVIASQPMAQRYSWHVGQRLEVGGWPRLTITGLYRIPDVAGDYWFGRGPDYQDALVTTYQTMVAGRVRQGSGVLDYPLVTARVRAGDIPALRSGIDKLANSTQLQLDQVIVGSAIPGRFAAIEASWRTVLVPVWLITAELLSVSWLLLFLTVTDAVEARGPEIALAKLRGRGRWRTLVFGLSEPTLLLMLALPLGVLIAWAATIGLGSLLLSPGTAVAMPAEGWLAAAAATAGGLIAVIIAGRKTLRRSVTEQWRRSGRKATDRGWVIDSILMTGAAAGLLNLAINGEISSTRHAALSLLVPGLLGLAVAVAASRVLPMACRAAFGRTGRRGGTAWYLAVRHIARRPGGIRTTIVLATAFALAAFAVAAWSVNRNNDRLVAYARTGAPTVLTVTTPPGKDLGAIVDKADPGGTQAAVVDKYVSLTSGSGGTVALGVDPQRFAHVAFWERGFAAQPLRALARRLAPPAPAPVTVAGSKMRVTVNVGKLSQPGEQLFANLTVGASPVGLGTLSAHRRATLTGSLVDCPCVLQGFYVQASGADVHFGKPISGSITFSGLAFRRGGRWVSARHGLFASRAAWTTGAPFKPDLHASAAGLQWNFDTSTAVNAVPALNSVNRPYPMPALAPSSMVAGRGRTFEGIGLDGSQLPVRIIEPVAAVPGATANGFIMDRRYAELATGQNFPQVQRQVWLAAGAARRIEPKLTAAGVHITSVATAAAAAARLARQGPALASVLFLADAAAAALLAAGAAILGLYLSARRRRYEYAALAASGVSRRTLRRAVLIELAVVLGFGTAVGIGTGLGAAALALRAVPEFITTPVAPPLSYIPSAGPLAALLGIAVGVLTAVAIGLSITIIRGVRLDQLREAPA